MTEIPDGLSPEMHGVNIPIAELSKDEEFKIALRGEIEKLLSEMEEFRPKLVYVGFRGKNAVVVVEGHDSSNMALRPINVVLVGRPGQMEKLDTSAESGGGVRVLVHSQYEEAYDYKEPECGYVIKGVTEGRRGRITYKIRVSEPGVSGYRTAEATSGVYMGKRNMNDIEDEERLPLVQFDPQ